VRELLTRHEQLAAERPDEPAIVYRRAPHAGIVLTWGGLWARAEALRAALLAAGARRGTVCALVLQDHPDLVPLLVALWQLESPPVLLDEQWGGSLTRNVLEHSTPGFLVSLDPVLEVRQLPWAGAETGAPADGVFIGYTSGSTGDPKAIVFTHERLYAGTLGNVSAATRLHGSAPRRLARSMRMSGSGVINLHHTWGAVMGACVVVLPELTVATARDYWTRVHEEEVEQTFLVPQLVELINRFATDREPGAIGPVCFTGSAPLSERTQERFQRRFGLPLFNAYGLSETSSAAFFGQRGADGLATHSIGVPERARARLRASDGSVVTGAGEGEIELSGDQVFSGYYRNPEASAATLVDGWLRTGDIGRRGEDGNYHLVGRSKDVVMKGSFAIYLTEVEAAAAAHPAVLEVAAVPLQLADSAEDIGCLVRLTAEGSATEAELLDWLREGLGAQRAPCRLVLTEQPLPRGGQDKLDRPSVAARWESLPNVPPTLRSTWAKAAAEV
jgi:long-chain acyl-CoA synthetase